MSRNTPLTTSAKQSPARFNPRKKADPRDTLPPRASSYFFPSWRRESGHPALEATHREGNSARARVSEREREPRVNKRDKTEALSRNVSAAQRGDSPIYLLQSTCLLSFLFFFLYHPPISFFRPFPNFIGRLSLTRHRCCSRTFLGHVGRQNFLLAGASATSWNFVEYASRTGFSRFFGCNGCGGRRVLNYSF